jgi:NAD+ kinase
MKVAIFGKKFDPTFESFLFEFINILTSNKIEVYIYKQFQEFISVNTNLKIKNLLNFENYTEIDTSFSFCFTFGGDGTFLEAIRYIRDKDIPLIGINTGRLGFLANIPKDAITKSLNLIFSGNYTIEKRRLITFQTNDNPFNDFPHGLNEVTVQKNGNSLITIHTELNGNFLHSYYADGLIISTPTGSTAYSMSVGGPIISPDCNAVIISPIAPHNLSVRPIVIPGEYMLKIKIESRNSRFLGTIDSQTAEFKTGTEVTLIPSPFSIDTIQLTEHNFFNTLRNKLNWGADIRI